MRRLAYRWILSSVVCLLVTTAGSAAVSAQDRPLIPSETEDIPFHVGRMYAKTPGATAWTALERVTQRLGLKFERRKPKEGVLVTRWMEQSGTRFQFHFFVPSGVEPARIYVGSLSVREGTVRYNDEGGNNALFAALAGDLGIPGEAIPLMPGRRALKSIAAAPADADVNCLRELVAGHLGKTFTKPEEISRADPATFRRGGESQRPGVVVVEGYLGEDGYFQPVRLVDGNPTNQARVFTAFALASMTRYRPGLDNHCGVPLTAQFSTTVWR